MKQLKQLLIIHGGDAHKTDEAFFTALAKKKAHLNYRPKRRWKENLQKDLGSDWQVITPQMPCRENARYGAWKAWFELHLKQLSPGALLVGHSLGGLFLAKYIAEEGLPEELAVRGVVLVAATHHGANPNATLYSFELPRNLERLKALGDSVVLVHSKDDQTVWLKDFEAYCGRLPGARQVLLGGYGHFVVERVPELLELFRSFFEPVSDI